MRPIATLGILILATLGACGPSDDGPAPPVQEDVGITEDTQDPPVQAVTARAVHRLTIEQIARSLPVVTGGISWTEDFGQGPMDILEVLSGTLGAPDYLLVTEENMEPSLIIAKFLTDASHRICSKWVERDRFAEPGARTLIVHEDWDSLADEDVRSSLRRLRLRFFSVPTPEGDDSTIERLSTLFHAAADAAPPGKEADDGWFAVCIAMMTDPAFVLY